MSIWTSVAEGSLELPATRVTLFAWLPVTEGISAHVTGRKVRRPRPRAALRPPRRVSGNEAAESAYHDPDRGPHRNGKRAAAPLRDAFAPAQRIEEEDEHESEGNPEDRPDENEDPGATGHGPKRSARAGPDPNDPEEDRREVSPCTPRRSM